MRIKSQTPCSTSTATPTAPSRTTLVAPSHKGGIGKSTIIRATIELMRSHLQTTTPYRCIGVDADPDNMQLLTFLGQQDDEGEIAAEQDALTGIISLNGRSSRERGQLLDLAESDAELIAIDLPGGSLTDLANLNENLGSRDLVEAHSEAGRRFVVVLAITPLLASISSVLTALEQFGPDADYVVVQNLAAGMPEDFILWEDGIVNKHDRKIGGQARAELLAANGRILQMPTLSPGTYALIDALGLTFTEALKSPQLRFSQRLSTRHWLHDWSMQLDSIADLLTLPADYSWRV